MKIRNKILTSALCLGMVASMVSPVLATDNSTDDHLTNISYTVDETYKWAAPADITFDLNSNTNEKTGTLEVTENVIAGGKKLQIKITDGQEFKITSAEGIKRDYTVTGATAGALSVGSVALEVNAGTNTGSDTLTFALQEVAVQQAGTYTGVLNFESAIVAQ
ncbi:MAG: hypothetical protein SOV49_03220 [Erysipelotrichaceae bacterium]|nr:hypothetical protein [Erysipelotrichaceae bacterium]